MRFTWDEQKNADTMKTTSKTNWVQVDALTDAQIDTTDAPPLGAEFFKKAVLRDSTRRLHVTVEVDADTLEWYQAQGESAQERMAAALSLYAAAHKAHRESN